MNDHIVPGNPKLGSTLLIVSAPITMKNIHVVIPCEHQEEILHTKISKDKNITYIIQLRFPVACEVSEISIGDSENIFTDTHFPLPIESLSQIEDNAINMHSTKLLTVMREQPVISEKSGTSVIEKLHQVQMLYKNAYILLRSDIAQGILRDRDIVKYISPVAGYKIPTKESVIPGAGRPYRKTTTDGIHHGWDIMAPLNTPVQALSKGKIIRIVNDWKWSDFSGFKSGKLTKDDEFLNLDIYRGNQVWLQTMDGNVVFYSHLSHIAPDIVVGSHVDRGEYIGNIGTSGVPDKNYKNIHLHFEIQKNPFREPGKVLSPLDIMRWDYIGEGMER
jgi:hypothetical protein